MLKRILIGLGGTSYTASEVRYAVELAQAHGAELTGATIIDINRLIDVGPVPSMGIGATSIAQEVREHRLRLTREEMGKAIDQFTAACRAAGVPHQVRQETGNPFDLVASMARYHDLMVFGLHAIFEFGVVDEPHDELARLVTEGVRPILTVAENYRPIRRVLVAYSGSMESAKTMKRFVQMRLWPEVLLRIVTFEHPENAARQLLDDAAEYCRAHGYEAETEYVPGSPLRQLLEYAGQWDADLIVAGNSAKSLLRRRIFGETALELMRNSDRPLFLSQ